MVIKIKLFVCVTILLAGLGLAGGCAFDIVHVRQAPVEFSPVPDGFSFVLVKGLSVNLWTGFRTRLRAGTRWECVGTTKFGSVYKTADQIVKVEASNMSEAYIVVSNQQLTGFYLPVEKTFAPISHPIPLETKTAN